MPCRGCARPLKPGTPCNLIPHSRPRTAARCAKSRRRSRESSVIDRMAKRIAPEGLEMTREQRQLVRQSLDRLREESDPVTLLLYGKLFELDPSTRRLFHNDIIAQGRKLMDTLDAIAGSLDRLDSMRPRLLELGRGHARYGVVPAHYDTLVTALIWAFTQALGPDFDSRTRDAWRLALGRVAAVMQEGAAKTPGHSQ